MDGRPNRRNIVALSNFLGVVWVEPKSRSSVSKSVHVIIIFATPAIPR